MKIKLLFLLSMLFQFIQLTGQIMFSINNIPIINEEDLNYEKPEVPVNRSDLFFELKVSNDMTYFTDRYFSSGIRMNLYAPFMAKSPFNKIMLPHSKSSQNYYALTFTHNMYTPDYIDTLSDRSIDHPFAAYFLMGNRKESYNTIRRFKVTSELQLGFIGPLAGGKVFQNTLHEYIPIAGHVSGWENQINNHVCFQYSSLFEKGIADAHWLEVNAYAGAKLGIPHTEAQTGIFFRFGYFDDYFRNIGINKSKTWQIWLFCAGDANYVIYNAVLQGGIINHKDSYTLQTINPLIWHTRFGGTLVYKTLKFEIAQEVASPSFPTGLWYRWAYISLMVGF